jgi:hypothetical protein
VLTWPNVLDSIEYTKSPRWPAWPPVSQTLACT